MPTKVVVGVQWGDEGKGKIIDILSADSDLIVRAQGGNNAGHTVENSGEIYKLRLVPSGILFKDKICCIGCGTVINPKSLLEEIAELKQRDISCENLRIDPRAHIVMPWHILIDHCSEKLRGNNEIGTTKRGIGPCYIDKADRIGLRMCDLVRPDIFEEKAKEIGKMKNRYITEIYENPPLDIDAVIKEYIDYGQELKKYMADISVITYEAIKQNKNILFEGAQGTMLDIDMGTYPYVTSSHPISGGVCTGSGIGPTAIDEVIGVSKAYTTRVGKGIFPTELFDNISDLIRQKGNEFGTNTGRPRRIGWFDTVLLRHAVRVNGLTSLVVNKLDTLSGIEKLKICTAYKHSNGKIIRDYPPSLEELALYEPVYEEIDGFNEDISKCASYNDLPDNCKAYIKRLETLCECPVNMIGIGPARTQILIK